MQLAGAHPMPRPRHRRVRENCQSRFDRGALGRGDITVKRDDDRHADPDGGAVAGRDGGPEMANGIRGLDAHTLMRDVMTPADRLDVDGVASQGHQGARGLPDAVRSDRPGDRGAGLVLDRHGTHRRVQDAQTEGLIPRNLPGQRAVHHELGSGRRRSRVSPRRWYAIAGSRQRARTDPGSRCRDDDDDERRQAQLRHRATVRSCPFMSVSSVPRRTLPPGKATAVPTLDRCGCQVVRAAPSTTGRGVR